MGHRVRLTNHFDDRPSDLMIALHSTRSAAAVLQSRKFQPDCPTFIVLTGTDLYGSFAATASARRALDSADRLIVLQSDAVSHVPVEWRDKVRVIYQSAEPVTRGVKRLRRSFEVCVSGHLRAVKDPFRTAMAARNLPDDSRIRVTHLGEALTPDMRRRAVREEDLNRRYHWMGAVPRWRAVRILARSRLLVISSRIEGGAGVASEALASGVPILASDISGNIGMLGQDYPGLFPVGKTEVLADMLYRSEKDDRWLGRLKAFCQRRARLVQPARELATWRAVWNELRDRLGQFTV